MSFRILLVILALVLAPIAAGLHYVLPRHDVVRIINTEVRRMDFSGNPVDPANPRASRDVYFIQAEDIETRKPHVYRNEDTGWGFPPYFKFNSADVQAIASSVAAEKGVARITKYGWRFTIFSMFPNATSVKRWDPADTVIPWFNIFFFGVIGVIGILVALRLRRRRA